MTHAKSPSVEPLQGSRTASRTQVVLLVGYAARLALALVVTALLGRYLSPDAFGFFTLVGTILFVAHILFDVGTSAVVVREVALAPERERDLLEAVLGWRRWSAVALGLCVLVWSVLEPSVERRIVLLAVALALPLLAPGALMSVFRVRQEQEGPEAIRFVDQLILLVGAFLFVRLGLPGAVFGLLLVLRSLSDAVAIGWLAHRRLGYRPRARLGGRDLKSLMSMSAFQGGALLVQMAYSHIDVILVLLMRGEAELGAYSAAFRPINPLLALPSLLTLPLLPVFSALARIDPHRLLPYVRRTTTLLVGIGSLAGVSGLVLAPDLVRLLYGGRYTSGALSASASLAWLSVAFALVLSSAVFGTALLALGGERQLLRFSLLGLLINVTGNLLLLPRWGFVAAAMTTALTYAAVGAAVALELVRRLGPKVLSASHLLPLLPVALVATLLTFVPGPPTFRVAVGVALGAVGSLLYLVLPSARHLRRDLAAASWTESEVLPPRDDGESPV